MIHLTVASSGFRKGPLVPTASVMGLETTHLCLYSVVCMESPFHSHSSQARSHLGHESCLQEILDAREEWERWIWREIAQPSVHLKGLSHSSSFLCASFFLAWSAWCFLQPILRPRGHSRAGTCQPLQVWQSTQMEEKSNLLLCLYLYLSCKHVWNRLDHMHPCGMSIPFSLFRILKSFLAKGIPELLLIMQFTAHRGRYVEGLS